MSLFPRLLFDMNALRYLDQLRLLKVCVGAVAEPCTLDLIRFTEMKNPVWEDVKPYGMQSCELTPEMMAEAVAVMGVSPKLSICDAGLIVLAKEYNIPVFTEDMAMVKVMSRQKVLHVSLPEMVDSLVDAGKISYEEGVSAFRRISTELLPGCAKKYPEILGKYSSSWKTDGEGEMYD